MMGRERGKNKFELEKEHIKETEWSKKEGGREFQEKNKSKQKTDLV